jgi:cellulose biosynthesis protein BcsQ
MLSSAVQDLRRVLDHPALVIIGVVLTKVQKNRQTAELEKALRQAHGKLVYRTTIPFAPIVETAHSAYRSVIEHSPSAAVSVAYGKLVTEIVNGDAKRRDRRAGQANHAA